MADKIKPVVAVALTSLSAVLGWQGILALIWALIARFTGHTEGGWASLMCSIWMIGGIQLLCLGVIGEYIGKIYKETKKRPRFIIERVLDANMERK